MSNEKTFTHTVEGEGIFEFKVRNMRLEFAIEREFSLLTGGQPSPAPTLANMARVFATVQVMTATAPENFDIWALDPLDEESFKRAAKVYEVLRERETFFRSGLQKGGDGSGAQGAQNAGVVVQD